MHCTILVGLLDASNALRARVDVFKLNTNRQKMAQPRYITLMQSTVKLFFNVVASKASASRG